MFTWLHHIGQSNYKTARAFSKEARKYGVTRRVSLQTMKRMHWGDRVVLAIACGKTPIIFAEFPISKISGISPAGIARLNAAFPHMNVIQTTTPRLIHRGCGTYRLTGEWSVQSHAAPLDAIADVLQKAKDAGIDIGKPMIGCDFVQYVQRNPVRMKNLPHLRGFRLFDYEQWSADVVTMTSNSKRWLTSLYYVDSDPVVETALLAVADANEIVWGSAFIEQVGRYQHRKEVEAS